MRCKEPEDIRNRFKYLYDSGHLFRYMLEGMSDGKELFYCRIIKPWKGSFKKVSSHEIFALEIFPWLKRWDEAVKEFKKYGFYFDVSKESGLAQCYTSVRMDFNHSELRKAFEFVEKEKEYDKIKHYWDVMKQYEYSEFLIDDLFTSKSFREWLYGLHKQVPKELLPMNLKDDEAEIACLVLEGIVKWCKQKPNTSLVYVKNIQLPYVGTKFFERNKGRICRIDSLLSGEREIKTVDEMLERHGVNLSFSAVHKVIMPAKGVLSVYKNMTSEEMDKMFTENPPKAVLLSENPSPMEKGFQFGNLLVIGGTGNALVKLAEDSQWLGKAEHVYHWGDCDIDGYSILNGLRKFIPHVQSFLMDIDTVSSVEDIWFTKDTGSKKTVFSLLTDKEREAVAFLCKGKERVRLEQEFIPNEIVQKELDKLNAILV